MGHRTPRLTPSIIRCPSPLRMCRSRIKLTTFPKRPGSLEFLLFLLMAPLLFRTFKLKSFSSDSSSGTPSAVLAEGHTVSHSSGVLHDVTLISLNSFPAHCPPSRGLRPEPHPLHAPPCGCPLHSAHSPNTASAQKPGPDPAPRRRFLPAHTHFPRVLAANILWAPLPCQTLHPWPLGMSQP